MKKDENFWGAYEKHLEISKRIAAQIVKDPSLAEDISHDVFLSLYEKAEQIDLCNEEKIRALIIIATRNKAYDYLKSARVKREVVAAEANREELWEHGDSLEHLYLKKEEINKKRAVLIKLREKNPNHFDILIKTKYMEVSPKHVAEEYGITRNNVNNRILKARAWLKKELLKLTDHETGS